MEINKVIFSVLLVILASCAENENQENSVNNVDEEIIVNIVDSLSIKYDESDNLLDNKFEPPIDINEIKQLAFLETTSGVLSKSESIVFCQPEREGFFRFYFLIDKTDDAFSVFGKLKVFVPDSSNNWRADFKGEHFSEIELNSNKIKVWEKIGVGSSLNELSDFIGGRNLNIKDSLINAEIGEYSIQALI